MKTKRRSAVVAVTAISAVLILPMTAMAAGPGNGGGGGGGGGGRPGGETVGNNLSFPVEWSEAAYQLVIPGTEGVPSIAGEVLPGRYTMDDPSPCLGAVQKDSNNLWQAENELVTPNYVTSIDWGDNLESKDWRVGQVVRVETGLYDEVLGDLAPMLRYEMCYISGSGTTEVWGLRVIDNGDGTYTPETSDSTEAMVYTGAARLTIQRIGDLGATPSLTWDSTTHAWTGAGAEDPTFNMATWQRLADGPGSYGAELNVQGKVVYGFVWTTRGLTAGEYRLTFSLDQAWTTAAGLALVPGVDFAADAIVRLPVEEVVAEAEGGGNTAVVLPGQHLTYIDVGLTAGGGGGGPRR